MKGLKVAHLTSVHKYNDTRIFLKECRSLAQAGYCVSLVAPDIHDCVVDGVSICGVQASQGGRLQRFTGTVWRVYKAARAIDADIYHFHDPELLPIGLLLKIFGKKVIYDTHEDLPRQILTKPWIKKPIRKYIAAVAELFEDTAVRFLNGVIAATPYIAKRFAENNINVVAINNYPLLHELRADVNISWQEKESRVCYVGGITYVRGICECVMAMSKTNVELGLAGIFESDTLRDEVSSLDGWKNVNYKGFIDRNDIRKLLNSSIAGLVALHPTKNYLDSLPVKMFEYMSAGIPVIASNFPLWQSIIEDNQCGICVDPLNPDSIASAINWLIQHPIEAEEMGNNGRKAVENIYNWDIEKEKLFNFYKKLI